MLCNGTVGDNTCGQAKGQRQNQRTVLAPNNANNSVEHTWIKHSHLECRIMIVNFHAFGLIHS